MSFFASHRFKLLLSLYWLGPTVGYSEAVTDGTVGAIRSLSGNFTIPQDLGTLRGQNLFHSFQIFNVQGNEHATFTGDAAIRNVITRVTGGNESRIDGFLTSQIGTADFYFINPAGVVIGKNAHIEIPAAFRVSTADELRLNDSGNYSASNPQASTLTVGAPETYGFLGDHSGHIRFELAHLTATPGQTLEFVGRDLQINGTSLQTEEGNVHLTAVGSGIQSLPLTNDASTPAKGTLTISGSSIDVSGAMAGQIYLRAGQIEMKQGSELRADQYGAQDANHSGIDIRTEAGNIIIDNSQIRISTWGNGKSSNLDVNSQGALLVNNGGNIRTETFASGNAGDVRVTAKGDITVQQEGAINSRTFNPGKGGNVNLQAGGKLTINGQTQTTGKASPTGNPSASTFTGIGTQSGACCANNAGNVDVSAGQGVFIHNQGSINSQGDGTSNSGSVTVTAPVVVVVDNSEINTFSAGGTAGVVRLNTQNLLAKNARISGIGYNQNSASTSDFNHVNRVVPDKSMVPPGQPGIEGAPPDEMNQPESEKKENSKKVLVTPALYRERWGGQTQESCRKGAGSSLVRSGQGGVQRKAAELKPLVGP